MSADFNLTAEMLTEIAALPRRTREPVMKAVAKAEWEKCADDIFYWLDPAEHFTSTRWPNGTPYVFTNDPHPMHQCVLCTGLDSHLFYTFNKRHAHLEQKHNIIIEHEKGLKQFFKELPGTRPFPYPNLPYIKPIVEAWLRYPLMVVEKSRDMTATWLTIMMYTWDTLFHSNRQNIFQSEDSSKTDELVQRANFIYKNQPKFLQDVHPAVYGKGTGKAGVLRLETLASEVIGFPAGADQIRQYHPSGFFSDEAAFQTAAGESFSAIKPAIQNGGRYTAVSSANPSFFQHLCRDTIHTVQDYS